MSETTAPKIAYIHTGQPDTGFIMGVARRAQTMQGAAYGADSVYNAMIGGMRSGADAIVLEVGCLNTDAYAAYAACKAAQEIAGSSRCKVIAHFSGREQGCEELVRALVTYGGAAGAVSASICADAVDDAVRIAAGGGSLLEVSAWIASEGNLPEIAMPKGAGLGPVRTQGGGHKTLLGGKRAQKRGRKKARR